MKRTSKELKRLSRQTLLGNYGLVALAFFICQLIVAVLSSPFKKQLNNYSQMLTIKSGLISSPVRSTTIPIGTLGIAALAIFIIGLLSIILSAGQLHIHMDLARKKTASISLLFSEFRNRPDRYILSTILLGLLTTVLMLPGFACLIVAKFYVPLVLWIIGGILTTLGAVIGIYLSLRFSLMYYYLIDDSSFGAIDAMKESFHAMKGHCGRKLYLILSFIPMMLLILFSIGIAAFWVQPYIYMTDVHFYLDVTGELTRKEEEARRMDEEMGPLMTDEFFPSE